MECIKNSAMKLKPSLLALLFAAMIPVTPVEATVNSRIESMLLTVRLQGDTDINGDLFIGDIVVVRVTARELLLALEDAYETDYPVGSSLMITTDGEVLVIDRDGNVLEVVEEYITAILDFDNSLFDGRYNVETEQENSRIVFNMWLNFSLPTVTPQGPGIQLPDFNLMLRGVAFESFNTNKPNQQGVQTSKGTIRADLTGSGDLDEDPIFGEGPIILRGKERDNVKVR